MLLLILLFFSHFLCDFTPLSTPIMLNAKRVGSPLGPIFEHACVHMLGISIVTVIWILTYSLTTDSWIILLFVKNKYSNIN